jgi:hypothetical protein
MSPVESAQIVSRMIAIWPQPRQTDATLEEYRRALGRWSFSAVVTALDALVDTARHFPRIAEIAELVRARQQRPDPVRALPEPPMTDEERAHRREVAAKMLAEWGRIKAEIDARNPPKPSRFLREGDPVLVRDVIGSTMWKIATKEPT